jgi:hypothetical protein
MQRVLLIAAFFGLAAMVACQPEAEALVDTTSTPDAADLCWLVDQPEDCLDDADGILVGTWDEDGNTVGSLHVQGTSLNFHGDWHTDGSHHATLDDHSGPIGVIWGDHDRTDDEAGTFIGDAAADGIEGDIEGLYIEADDGTGMLVARFYLR